MRNSRANNTASITLWVRGASEPVEAIWLSETHIELVVRNGLILREDEIAAVVMRNFLSLPVRVEMQTGVHLVLRFDQRPHPSVHAALERDLFEIAMAKAEDASDQGSLFPGKLGDLEVLGEAVEGEVWNPIHEAA
ncbi:MAG: hypothetical protein AAGK17_01880 [Pseudomonadota bacterium]